jgi:hypothetical protein
MHTKKTTPTSSDDASNVAATTQQPNTLPTFRWRPDLVSGIPIRLDIFFLADEIPTARFHENEKPYFLPMDLAPKSAYHSAIVK